MFFHDYIQTLHSRSNITLAVLPPSQDITLEARDFQLPLICNVKFDHLVSMLSDFSAGTVTFSSLLLISNLCGDTLTPSKYLCQHALLNLASIDDSSLNQVNCDGCNDSFLIPKSCYS